MRTIPKDRFHFVLSAFISVHPCQICLFKSFFDKRAVWDAVQMANAALESVVVGKTLLAGMNADERR